MNKRFLPGGDKFESIHEDDRRAFCDRVQAEQEEILSALRTVVSCWSENQIDDARNPTFERFIDAHPEWNHEEVYEIIGEELHRAKHGSCR